MITILALILTFFKLRHELPGKALQSVPRKEISSQTAVVSTTLDDDDDSVSVSSFKTFSSSSSESQSSHQKTLAAEKSHARTPSRTGGFFSATSNYLTGSSSSASVNNDTHGSAKTLVLWRETQRISLRAYLRILLADPQVAKSKAIRNFLSKDPIIMNEAELADEKRRKEMDVARIEEQKKFFQIAQKRARELDVYMEGFRRDIVERSR